jgi:CheY-like chemotaxis protein
LVLVIDDDASARDLMTRHLEREGFRVRAAASGEEGLRLARELEPSAITLDVVMPSMDGWAVLAALKEEPRLAAIPVFMVTMIEDRQIGFALGATDYLTKPIDRDRLVALLSRWRASAAGGTVLLVEDDPLTREMARRAVESAGWTVVEAENGRVALAALEHEHPTLVLLDLMMPEMDGFAFLDEFRADNRYNSVPVVVLTAKDITAEERERLNGHVARVLQKGSVRREDLVTELARLIGAGVASGVAAH